MVCHNSLLKQVHFCSPYLVNAQIFPATLWYVYNLGICILHNFLPWQRLRICNFIVPADNLLHDLKQYIYLFALFCRLLTLPHWMWCLLSANIDKMVLCIQFPLRFKYLGLLQDLFIARQAIQKLRPVNGAAVILQCSRLWYAKSLSWFAESLLCYTYVVYLDCKKPECLSQGGLAFPATLVDPFNIEMHWAFSLSLSPPPSVWHADEMKTPAG